jgi:general secretion pathway protein B
MSLILDALRKAERERELGRVPTIGSQLPHHRRAPRRRRAPWLAGGALASIALVAAGAWWVRERSADAPSDAPSQPAVTSTPQGDQAPTPPAPDVPGAGQPTAPETAPDPALEARALAERALAVAEAARRAAEQAAKAAVPAEPAPGSVAPDPIEAAQPAAMPTAVPDRLVEPVAPPAAIEPDPAGALPTSVPAPEKPEAAMPAADPPPPPAVPLIWELPPGVRQSLPRLAIAMHVYAEDPQRRFVILNEQRLVEGESTGGVSVREIRRDGVVLEAQGQRFLLPRGGL